MGRLQDSQYSVPSFQKKKQNNIKIKEDRAENEAKLQATFCPPLDPSLIQAIWNDSFNYDASFEVLTSLAKEAESTLDQQEALESSMDQLDLDESTTTTTTTTTTESEDENINFLITCFPTYPLQDLIYALKAQDNDVEKATDLLLNREFLEGAELEGSVLRRVEDEEEEEFITIQNKRNNKTTKKKKNNQSNSNKKKKGTVWTSGQLPENSTTQGHTTMTDIKRPKHQFDDDDDDDDPYNKLATVPFNVWHQYDKKIENLQSHFTCIPQITIANCVQHCRGNIIASVKMIMEKHPQEKPEHGLPWALVRDLCNVKQELEAIMVDRTPDDIYRVAVGIIIQFEHETNKSVDQLVQIGIEHFLSFDVTQLELEVRLKKMAQESELIRAKRKKSEMPVIPEYLLMNNQQTYQEVDPEECRNIAMELIIERNELFRKAAAAYRSAKNKGPGESGIAFYYSDNARQLDSRAKDWNMRAARATVRAHRIKHNDDHVIDLHGLTVAEAQVLIREAVTQWWSRSQMQSSRKQFQPLKIITGVGKHSQYGESKLLPSTKKLLKKEGWQFDTTNPGCIYVTGILNKK